jgi:uncharacterized protein YcbX
VIDEGEKAAHWFSDFLGMPCRLVRMGRDFGRRVDEDQAVRDCRNNLTSLTDGWPFLLISEESLAGLNEKLHNNETNTKKEENEEDGEDEEEVQQPHEELTVDMRRFRPNIVVKGAKEPHEEDHWQKVKVFSPSKGDTSSATPAEREVVLHVALPCERCTIPNIDPDTGIENFGEPTRTLKTYRGRRGRHYFGQYLQHDQSTGKICVGDKIMILQRSTSSNLDTL